MGKQGKNKIPKDEEEAPGQALWQKNKIHEDAEEAPGQAPWLALWRAWFCLGCGVPGSTTSAAAQQGRELKQ